MRTSTDSPPDHDDRGGFRRAPRSGSFHCHDPSLSWTPDTTVTAGAALAPASSPCLRDSCGRCQRSPAQSATEPQWSVQHGHGPKDRSDFSLMPAVVLPEMMPRPAPRRRRTREPGLRNRGAVRRGHRLVAPAVRADTARPDVARQQSVNPSGSTRATRSLVAQFFVLGKDRTRGGHSTPRWPTRS